MTYKTSFKRLSWISSKASQDLVDDLYPDIASCRKERKYGRHARRSGFDQIMPHNQEKKLRREKGIDSAWLCDWCKCYFRDLTVQQFFAHVFKCYFPSMNENKTTKLTRVERGGPVVSRKREKKEGERGRKKIEKGAKQGGEKGRKKVGKEEDKDLERGGKKNGKGEDKNLIQWEPPDGSFAMDCDASVKQNVAGSAFIIRDKLDHFILAGVVARWRSSVIYHETDAIRSGLNNGSRIGLNDDVVVRSDSRWAIDSFHGQANPSPDVTDLLADVRHLQHSFLGDVSFKHMRREANRAADILATNLTKELIEDRFKEEDEPKKYPNDLPFEIIYQYPMDLPIEIFRILREDRSGKRIPKGKK